jgi:hypothetical protein
MEAIRQVSLLRQFTFLLRVPCSPHELRAEHPWTQTSRTINFVRNNILSEYVNNEIITVSTRHLLVRVMMVHVLMLVVIFFFSAREPAFPFPKVVNFEFNCTQVASKLGQRAQKPMAVLGKYALLAMAALNLLKEIFQIYQV